MKGRFYDRIVYSTKYQFHNVLNIAMVIPIHSLNVLTIIIVNLTKLMIKNTIVLRRITLHNKRKKVEVILRS